MNKSTASVRSITSSFDPLSEALREGARKMLAQALLSEVESYCKYFENLKDDAGRRLVTRNGFAPEREIQTGLGAIPLTRPKVRFRGNEDAAPHVKVTLSGLAYEIVKPGSNVKPGPNDTVEVHYHGTFLDGTVFDSSVDRKEKISFPLNAVIKGWTEGLQLIGEGGEIKLVVTSDLGYADRGSVPKIPGGATLLFTVTLYKVTKG